MNQINWQVYYYMLNVEYAANLLLYEQNNKNQLLSTKRKDRASNEVSYKDFSAVNFPVASFNAEMRPQLLGCTDD